jgi:hypothetical protein
MSSMCSARVFVTGLVVDVEATGAGELFISLLSVVVELASSNASIAIGSNTIDVSLSKKKSSSRIPSIIFMD